MTPAAILATVAEEAGISVDDLLVHCRRPHLLHPRQLAMYLIRERCGMPWDKAGLEMDREQSTIWKGFRAARKRLAGDPAYRDLYERVCERLAA